MYHWGLWQAMILEHFCVYYLTLFLLSLLVRLLSSGGVRGCLERSTVCLQVARCGLQPARCMGVVANVLYQVA